MLTRRRLTPRTVSVDMPESLTERVSARLMVLAETRGFKTALAARMGYTQASITPYTKGERAVPLEMLEAIAEVSQIPVCELIAEPGTLYQLDGQESALIRHLRRWPKSVTHALVAFVGFFADEPPIEAQTRNLHELWRGLPPGEKEWLYGVAVMLRERTLPPDLRAGLVDRLTNEATRGVKRFGRERATTTRRPSDDDEQA